MPTLDALASSVEVRRELASLLSHIDAAAARSECEEIKREWVLNCQYWKHELQVAQQDVDIVEERMSSEIRDVKAHYQDQVEALKADKAALKSQIADLQAQFLQENSEISGNWNRLHDLLVSYQEDTIRKKPVPDFKKRLSEERARQAAEAAAKNTRVLDLTRPDTDIPDSQSKSPRYLVYSSKSSVRTLSPKRPFTSDLRSLKRRPSGHQPIEDS
ncbi:Hypothetical protein PHPALM_8400, partial [Phytophthora palmivora]